jgi:hypothetical protein
VLRSTNEALRDAADRLVAERHDLPPGAVLRCFSRAVRTALLRGHPVLEVAAVAADLTQEELAWRLDVVGRPADRAERSTDLRLPRPRRAT